MVNNEAPTLGGLMNPVLLQILGNISQPKFTGKSDDWEQFAKDWQEYIRVISTLVPGGSLPDVLLLQVLKGCLDEATKKELQKTLEGNPLLTYALFWAQLQKEFGGDINFQHRASWEMVHLDP